MTPELLYFAFLPDLGGGEMMLILFVMLLLFGGDKMPQMAKKLAKGLREFKRAAGEVEREIKRAIDEVPDLPDVRKTVNDALEDKPKRPALPPTPPIPPPPAVTPSAIGDSTPPPPPVA